MEQQSRQQLNGDDLRESSLTSLGSNFAHRGQIAISRSPEIVVKAVSVPPVSAAENPQGTAVVHGMAAVGWAQQGAPAALCRASLALPLPQLCQLAQLGFISLSVYSKRHLFR